MMMLMTMMTIMLYDNDERCDKGGDSDAAGTGLRGIGGQTGGKNCPQASLAKEGEEEERGIQEGENEKKKRCNKEGGNKKETVTFLKKVENSPKRLIAGMRKSEQEGEGLDWNEEKDREETEQGAGGNFSEGGSSEEEERRRKLWEGERRRNEQRRRREEGRRREENQGDRWRCGRGKGDDDEEEMKRREEAARSNARMERRWNELTSSTRWNGGQQKEEKEEKRRQGGRQQETHLGPSTTAAVSYEGSSGKPREEEEDDLPENRQRLGSEMMVRESHASISLIRNKVFVKDIPGRNMRNMD